jgi:hypothetical protein
MSSTNLIMDIEPRSFLPLVVRKTGAGGYCDWKREIAPSRVGDCPLWGGFALHSVEGDCFISLREIRNDYIRDVGMVMDMPTRPNLDNWPRSFLPLVVRMTGGRVL